MNWPYELQIGWRYTRAGRGGRRNGFISFISGVSMLGIALGVWALIVVLSVMNGFRKEVQDRMLSVIPHVEVLSADGNALPDWQATVAIDRNHAITNSLDLRTTADMFASDGYFLSPTLDPNQVQGSYAKFNARIALGTADRRWEVALLGRNLFDKRTVSMGVGTPLAFSTFGAYSQANVVDEGRTVALQGRFNF